MTSWITARVSGIRGHWRLATTAVMLAQLAGVLLIARLLSGPAMTPAQALKHSNGYLLRLLFLHICAVFLVSASIVLTAFVLWLLLVNWARSSRRLASLWHRLLVPSTSRWKP